MSELPNPANFEAASAVVRPEDIREQFVVGPDPQAYAERVRTYAEAGFDHLVPTVTPDHAQSSKARHGPRCGEADVAPRVRPVRRRRT